MGYQFFRDDEIPQSLGAGLVAKRKPTRTLLTPSSHSAVKCRIYEYLNFYIKNEP
jgi:hypothetical protein